MESENIINCPECDAEINVNEALYNQLEDQIKKDYDKKSAKKEKEIQKQLQEVEAEKEQVKKEREKLRQLLIDGINSEAGEPMTQTDWDELKAEVKRRAEKRAGSAQ